MSSEELEKLSRVLEIDGGIRDNAILLNDGHGRNSRLSVWSHPGKDITGMLARSDKVAGTIEEVMDIHKHIMHNITIILSYLLAPLVDGR